MRVCWWHLLVLTVIFPLHVCAESDIHSRNLHCDSFELARTRTICHALEREMKWTWFGHSIIAPGFRPSFEGVVHVFCTLPITAADAPAVFPMTSWVHQGNKLPDWRLENGAQWLVFLLGKSALSYAPSAEIRENIEKTISDPASIWNTSNPQYPLRNGCR